MSNTTAFPLFFFQRKSTFRWLPSRRPREGLGIRNGQLHGKSSPSPSRVIPTASRVVTSASGTRYWRGASGRSVNARPTPGAQPSIPGASLSLPWRSRLSQSASMRRVLSIYYLELSRKKSRADWKSGESILMDNQ